MLGNVVNRFFIFLQIYLILSRPYAKHPQEKQAEVIDLTLTDLDLKDENQLLLLPSSQKTQEGETSSPAQEGAFIPRLYAAHPLHILAG